MPLKDHLVSKWALRSSSWSKSFQFFRFFKIKQKKFPCYGPPWAPWGCGPREKFPGVPPCQRPCMYVCLYACVCVCVCMYVRMNCSIVRDTLVRWIIHLPISHKTEPDRPAFVSPRRLYLTETSIIQTLVLDLDKHLMLYSRDWNQLRSHTCHPSLAPQWCLSFRQEWKGYFPV